MIKPGKKTKEWMKAKPMLVAEYERQDIRYCEGSGYNPACNLNWALSIHHLDKRSSGKAQHTFEATRLLCPSCHNLADHPQDEKEKEFNEILRTLR